MKHWHSHGIGMLCVTLLNLEFSLLFLSYGNVRNSVLHEGVDNGKEACDDEVSFHCRRMTSLLPEGVGREGQVFSRPCEGCPIGRGL